MNLENKSAIESCEMVLKCWGSPLMSEDLKRRIEGLGGKCYKVSNLERRMRESDNIRSVKVKGKNYVTYAYIA